MTEAAMTKIITEAANTQAVVPSRLKSGQWCHRAQKTIGQGDIAASYSADRIGMAQPVRKPFSWQGGFWVCVGMGHLRGVTTAEAYRLIHPQVFDGEPLSYSAKTANSEAARADPNGFYHGMSVKHAGQIMILAGPPATFAPGQAEQGDLFSGLDDHMVINKSLTERSSNDV